LQKYLLIIIFFRSDGSETVVDDNVSEEEYAEEGPVPFGMED